MVQSSEKREEGREQRKKREAGRKVRFPRPPGWPRNGSARRRSLERREARAEERIEQMEETPAVCNKGERRQTNEEIRQMLIGQLEEVMDRREEQNR